MCSAPFLRNSTALFICCFFFFFFFSPVPFHRESNSIVAPTLRKRLSNGSTSCSPRSITGTIFMHDEHSLLSSDNDGSVLGSVGG